MRRNKEAATTTQRDKSRCNGGASGLTFRSSMLQPDEDRTSVSVEQQSTPSVAMLLYRNPKCSDRCLHMTCSYLCVLKLQIIVQAPVG